LDHVGLLLVSGEETASNPRMRELGERADAVAAVSMYADPVRGWVDVLIPGTSYLERDGTYVNLEGRPQRLRRAVIPPAPDELAWIAKLAERFDVELAPHATAVHAELSPLLFDGAPFGALGERAELPPRHPVALPIAAPAPAPAATEHGGPLHLLRYRPLFSAPAVAFQRPAPEIELSTDDARVRGISPGDTVRVSSNGTSVELRARIEHDLVAGVARAAEEFAAALAGAVEVSRT